MRITKRLLALLLAACLLCGFSSVVAAAQVLQGNFSVTLHNGENAVSLAGEDTILVMDYIPGEAGEFRFSLVGENCTLHTVYGSRFYLYGPQAVEDNVLEKEIKESYANSPMLIGVSGTGTATLIIERVGEAGFDINALPYETYEATAQLSKFTLDDTIEELVYVDITEPHTAVLGEDGNYHLDTADGPMLYINFAGAPYISISAAASYGNMKDVLYDENGKFIKKVEFISCINTYYGYTDNRTGRWVEGYTDGGIYPLTYDMVYIMQTHTENHGWNDITSPNYLFKTDAGTKISVDADTAWMFPMCYGLYKGDINGDFVTDSADAVHLLYHTLLPGSYSVAVNGDINGDKAVTAADALYLLYHVLLPAQYPFI